MQGHHHQQHISLIAVANPLNCGAMHHPCQQVHPCSLLCHLILITFQGNHWQQNATQVCYHHHPLSSARQMGRRSNSHLHTHRHLLPKSKIILLLTMCLGHNHHLGYSIQPPLVLHQTNRTMVFHHQVVHLMVLPEVTLPGNLIPQPIHLDTHHQCMGEMEASMAVMTQMILPSHLLQANTISRSSPIERNAPSYVMMLNTVSGWTNF